MTGMSSKATATAAGRRAGPPRTVAPALALLLALGGVLTGCVETYRGAEVALVLRPSPPRMGHPAQGEHFELFATVHGSAVSLHRLCLPAFGSEVRDCASGVVLGVLDASDSETGKRITGVRFRTPVDLSDASGAFLTREPDDDPDPAPSGDTVLRAILAPASRGTLSGTFESLDTSTFGSGAITVVPAEDETY